MKSTLIEAIVLSVLASGEHYAHGIVRTVERVSAGRIQLHRSSVHYVLRRLVRRGLAATHWRVTPNGRREEELHYRLTSRGHAAFELLHVVFRGLWAQSPASTAKRLKRVAGL